MTTWFITGISRGLGKALAEAVLARGDTVIGTIRGTDRPVEEGPGRLHILSVDLSDSDAAETVTHQAFDIAGEIDIVVNNAGYGLLGALEMAASEDVARLFSVDVFAPFRIIKSALPYLRAQRRGHIINITSVAGRAPGVGTAMYSAAKAALEGMSAGLASEVEPFGIKVTAVAPGAFRTDFLSAYSIRKRNAAGEAYAETVGKSSVAFDAADGRQAGDPVLAAQAILDLVNCDNPPLHLLLGSDALRRARSKIDQVVEEINAWEAVTRSTDFAEA